MPEALQCLLREGHRGQAAPLKNAHSNDGTDRGEQQSENDRQDTGIVHNSTSGKWCKISDIPVHGDTLTGKSNNIIRILFENVDGFVIPDERDKNQIK